MVVFVGSLSCLPANTGRKREQQCTDLGHRLRTFNFQPEEAVPKLSLPSSVRSTRPASHRFPLAAKILQRSGLPHISRATAACCTVVGLHTRSSDKREEVPKSVCSGCRGAKIRSWLQVAHLLWVSLVNKHGRCWKSTADAANQDITI